MAATARPSYAECVERGRRRVDASRASLRDAARWLATTARAA